MPRYLNVSMLLLSRWFARWGFLVFLLALSIVSARADDAPRLLFAQIAGGVAQMGAPRGVAYDAQGNLYFSDTTYHVLRKVDTDGTMTIVAGVPGTRGRADGSALQATFSEPHGLAFGPQGDLYIADKGNRRVRKLSTDGIVSTVAGGGGMSIYQPSPAHQALFYEMWDVAVDSKGVIYVADGPSIRRIGTDGITSLFYGGMALTSWAVDVDANDIVYFTDAVYRTVWRSRFPGQFEQWGVAASPQDALSWPVSIAALGDGSVLVGDMGGGGIYRISNAGVLSWWVRGDGALVQGAPLDAARNWPFSSPDALAAGRNDRIAVADAWQHTIARVSSSRAVSKLIGDPIRGATDGASAEARFRDPQAVAIGPSGDLYIVDTRRLRKIDAVTGQVSTIVGSVNDSDGNSVIDSTSSIAVDRDGRIFFTRPNRHIISRIDPNGTISVLAGRDGREGYADGVGSSAAFTYPSGLVVDPRGDLLVADRGNRVIRRITPSGEVSTFVGTAGVPGTSDGKGTSAQFAYPTLLAISEDGVLYVGDASRIRKVTSEGEVTTLAGSQEGWSIDGRGAEAQFGFLHGLTVGSDGIVYVTEARGSFVRAVEPNGQVTTISAPEFFFHEAEDGTRPFNVPSGIAAGRDGRLYVTTSRGAILAAERLYNEADFINLSVLKRAGSGDDLLIAGFVIRGLAAEPTLMRAVGPGLLPHGVTQTILENPRLDVFSATGERIHGNDDWSAESAPSSSMSAVGAFSLAAGSPDSALVSTLQPAAYTAHVTTANSPAGLALVEIYDADRENGSRFVNLSTLARISPESSRLIAGFVVLGTGPKTVLIRAAGPSLKPHGIPESDLLTDPRLTLYRRETVIAENTDWGGDPMVKAAANRAGAFGYIGPDSKDAALLINLEPGEYTVHVEGPSRSSGKTIVEIYEVP